MNYIRLSASKKILHLAIPSSATGLLNIVTNFAAILMVAQLGREALAASAIATSTFITVMTILTASLFATGILISHQQGGTKDPKNIGKITSNSLYCGFLLCLPTTLLLWNGNEVLYLFKQSPALVALTTTYFHYAALTMLPMVFAMVISQFFIAIGRPNFNLITTAIRIPFVIVLSYALILGKFGFPKMELGGVSAAFFYVQVIATLLLLLYLYLSKAYKQYALFSNFTFDFKLCKQIFDIGLPIGIQFCGEIGAMTVATYMLGHLGIIPLAASQIVSQFAMFVVMITLGLSQAVSILVSRAYATFDNEQVKILLSSSFATTCVIFTVILGLFAVVPKPFIHLFIDSHAAHNAELISLTHAFLIISMFTLFIDCLRNIYSGVLRGLHDSRSPMRIGVFCLWAISIPACYFVGFTLQGGPIGLRIAFMSGFIAATIWLRFKTANKIGALVQLRNQSNVTELTPS